MSKVAMISIIDDEELVREPIADLISSLGHEPLIFGSAEQFLASGRVEDTACIITDLHMTGLSGQSCKAVFWRTATAPRSFSSLPIPKPRPGYAPSKPARWRF
jgi:FixJ family two-component response regulator